jgi:hypothetical protein
MRQGNRYRCPLLANHRWGKFKHLMATSIPIVLRRRFEFW